MRSATIMVASVLLVNASGCTLCAPGYLHDYAAVGGKWQRSDPASGRVGSTLSDPGTIVEQEYIVEDGYYGEGIDGDVSYDLEYGAPIYSSEIVQGEPGRIYADVVEGDTYREQNSPRVAAPNYDDVMSFDDTY